MVKSVTVEKWLIMSGELAKDGAMIPLKFKVAGYSMEPFIRKGKDEVTILPVKRRIRTGDIVLFAAKCLTGDYCLHRVRKISDGVILTRGDNCDSFDEPLAAEKILGVASSVKRGERVYKCGGVFDRLCILPYVRIRPIRKRSSEYFRRLKRLFRRFKK